MYRALPAALINTSRKQRLARYGYAGKMHDEIFGLRLRAGAISRNVYANWRAWRRVMKPVRRARMARAEERCASSHAIFQYLLTPI